MIPSQADPRWRDLIEHPHRHTYSYLALKILMHRVALESLGDLQATLDEIYAFFKKNERLMQDDIAAIFG